MKYYDIIKTMTLEEMAAVFYMFIAPALEGLNLTEDEKKDFKKRIHDFLNTESGKVGKTDEKILE